jgi:hypothetical protein
MDVATLIRKVQRLFGDDQEIFITEQDIIDWANEGRRDIAKRTKQGFLSSTFTASTGSYTWNTATSYPPIRRVLYGVKPLPHVAVEDFDAKYIDLTTVGVPQFYYLQGPTLYLWPVPSGTDATVVTVESVSVPADLTLASTDLVIPAQFHDDLVIFCLSRAHHRNQDHNAADRTMSEYERNLFQRLSNAQDAVDSFSVIRDDPWDYDWESNYVW